MYEPLVVEPKVAIELEALKLNTGVVLVTVLPESVVKSPDDLVVAPNDTPFKPLTVEPKDTAVAPKVMLELVNAELGTLVNDAPEPLNTVAANVPVKGTKLNLVEDVLAPVIVPVVTVDKAGYTVVPDVVSSVITKPVAAAADHVGKPPDSVKT